MRQELWALLAVHQAVRRFARAAAASGPVLDADRLSYLRCVRIARRSVPSQHDTSRSSLTNAWKEAGQEARSRLLPPRSGQDWPRAIKKPMRWPILRNRSGRSKVMSYQCSRCGAEDKLHRARLCTRCTIADRLDELLDDGTGRIRPELLP
ncbi:hypothetical protein AB0K74_43590 [Streptomyces sp. NPDC056159]|uniref:hypothetical protein n=1 Tax=unclassified Streptomyces TaxID=2593676 RepID=UPI00343CBF1D